MPYVSANEHAIGVTKKMARGFIAPKTPTSSSARWKDAGRWTAEIFKSGIFVRSCGMAIYALTFDAGETTWAKELQMTLASLSSYPCFLGVLVRLLTDELYHV